MAFHAERHLETAPLIEGGEAESVVQQLASRFRSPFLDRVVPVVQGVPDPDVSGLLSRLDLADPIFLGPGGGTFVLIGLAPASGSLESLVSRIRDRALLLQAQFHSRYPGVKLQLTGEIPLNFDHRKACSDEVQKGEGLVVPATIALLLLAFGSLVAAGLITSTAAIMIVVFAGFGLGDFLVVKMLGFTLAVAVLMDATLVRTVIGPALLSLAGDCNWWPWGLKAPAGARVVS
jgi:RND superfamily putative drug exporter